MKRELRINTKSSSDIELDSQVNTPHTYVYIHNWNVYVRFHKYFSPLKCRNVLRVS